MCAASRFRNATITPKGQEGMLSFWSVRRNSKGRPEITAPYNLVHLTHVGFDPVTGEFNGIINETLVTRASRHGNIFSYIDSSLYKNEL
jgi:hypothetical protein